MPRDLLARGMRLSGDLSLHMMVTGSQMVAFTPEQVQAIEAGGGELFLDAAAGSGKTSVLVERFVQAVIEDGIDTAAILTITFTDKAAAQMRDRIRARLNELGAQEAARATETAYISTIHGLCARLLRAHSLQVGIDPAFTVLDELEAGRLADAAFEQSLTRLAEQATGGVELIASYGAGDLRSSIQALYAELRSRGELRPRLRTLPELPEANLVAARAEVVRAAAQVSAELETIPDPSARVCEALERLGRLGQVLIVDAPWPGELDRLRLPSGNGAALTTPACAGYTDALTEFRAVCERRWAQPAIELLSRLLVSFGEQYERQKRARAGLDFEDLELLCLELIRSDAELRAGYRVQFERVMVDELQDTNAVQLELIEALSRENLFTVGDAQQSIYGFRHADVERFARRGERLEQVGRRATLRTNFRSRPEILDVVNRVFSAELGERFLELVPGRTGEPVDGPGDGHPSGSRVELLVADKGSEWSPEGPAAPWRVAEARALAARVAELRVQGVKAGDIVVLIRATTDMRAYERALEERGIPTYTVGGRGYWSHPQVVDLVAYLRVLANPRDEEALYAVLGSPLVGASLDALVLLAAAARGAGRDPWWLLREPDGGLAELASDDHERCLWAAEWIAAEREAARRKGVEELLDRALQRTGYDLEVLAMPGGQRRLANVRKLMRLGREHFVRHGPDLYGFVELVSRRGQWWRPDPDDSEAPIESEGLDAVRLMTIHRAKGLEFEIVCVADLGRGGRSGAEIIRVGQDGRIGLRLARPGTGRRVPALAYDELGEEQRARAAGEERRLFYVAMTRARERLILSGAAKVEAWDTGGGGGTPIGWLGPALVDDVSAGEGVSDGVRFRVVRAGDLEEPVPGRPPGDPPPDEHEILRRIEANRRPAPVADAAGAAAPSVTSLSYSSLAAYKRCGYRFYVERVLGVPPVEERGEAAGAPPPGARGSVLSPTERGIVVHALLERFDFRRPVVPTSAAIIGAAPRPPSASELEVITGLFEQLAATELCARLGRATWIRREQRFGFLVDGGLITGMLDVIAGETGGRMLVVDYKTDRLERSDPATVVARHYSTQQLIYALAALRAGAAQVEVAHVFLEAPDRPVIANLTAMQVAELEPTLAALTEELLQRKAFPVTDAPHREVCRGCPAEGGLCSWPLEMTRRASAEQLF